MLMSSSQLSIACTIGSMQRLGLNTANPAGIPMRRVLAALFLAGTVLLCQGLFGVLHQFSDVSTPMVGHFSALEAAHSGDHSGGHSGAWNCVAAILVVFLGAGILLLRKGIRSSIKVAGSLLADRYFPLNACHPLSRGSPALLQVFRL
jgi:hypothetical protein